jgi:MFS family permease
MGEILGSDSRVVVLALARLTEALGNSMLVIALPVYIASGLLSGGEFGLTQAFFTGIVLSATGVISSVGQPLTGRLSDHLGERTPFVFGGLGVRTVALAGYIVTPSGAVLAAFRVLQGIGSAFTVPAALALISEYSTTGNRGGSMGIYTAFRLTGSLVGIFLAGVLLAPESATYAYRLPLLGPVGKFTLVLGIAAVGAALSTALVGLFVGDPEETRPLARKGLLINVFSGEADRVLDPVFVGGLAALLFGICIAMIEPLSPIINERLSQSSLMFSLQYGGLIVALVVFASPFGTLGDRYGRRPFIVGAWFVLVPATVVQGYVDSSVGLLAARLAQGFAAAMAFAPAIAMVGDFAEREDSGSGTQMAVFSMLLGIGLAVGPAFSGFLVEFGFAVPFVAAAVMAVFAAVLVYTQIPETHARIVSGDMDPLWTRLRRRAGLGDPRPQGDGGRNR